jgi:RHS repeat-associated protein
VDALVNNRGHEVERYTYDAYGMPVMRAIRTTDVDYNGTVNAVDLGLVQAATDPCTDGPMLDIDGNGTINATDQGLVQSSYGSAIATLYTSGLGNAYFFTGRRMHHFDSNLIDLGPAPNTAIQYNRARHYDLQHGRWLQRDPLIYVDGMNLYQYVVSRPANEADPTGEGVGPGEGSGTDNPVLDFLDNYIGRSGEPIFLSPFHADQVMDTYGVWLAIDNELDKALAKAERLSCDPPETVGGQHIERVVGQATAKGRWRFVIQQFRFSGTVNCSFRKTCASCCNGSAAYRAYASCHFDLAGRDTYDFHVKPLTWIPGVPYNILWTWQTDAAKTFERKCRDGSIPGDYPSGVGGGGGSW